jgi:hypothetical protein
MFFERERTGPGILDRIAQTMQRADAGISAPRKDKLFGAAHSDELVVDQIRRHPDERQPLAPLADRFVGCGKRNQMCEALHGDAVAVMQMLPDRRR